MLEDNNKVVETTSNVSNEVSVAPKSEQISDSALVLSTISKSKTSSPKPDQPEQKEETEELVEQTADAENSPESSEEDTEDSSKPNEVPNKTNKDKSNVDLTKENELLKKRLEKARESIGRYSRQKHEWQDRYKALEAKYQKIESTEAPERDDYASDAAYDRAMAKFDNLKEQAMERVKTEYNNLMTEHTETFKERIETQVQEPQKFHATMQKYGKTIATNEPIVWKTFNDSPVGPMVMEFFVKKIFADKNQSKLWGTYTDVEKQEHVQKIERGILQHVRNVGQVPPNSPPNKQNPPSQSKAPKTLAPEFKENKGKSTGLSDMDLVLSTIKKK